MKLDKRACRHAANVPLHISLNAGVLYTERVKYLVTAAVKLLGGHRVLTVYFYDCERLKTNDRMPKWVVFQGKDTFATLERDAEGNVKWRDAMLMSLADESFYNFRESCVFYKGTDGAAIADFIHRNVSGIAVLKELQNYQYSIRNKQAKARRCKRDADIVEKMKKVPAAPSNFYEPTKEAMQVSTYLRVYRRHPKLIEHLVKVGFERIVSDIVYRHGMGAEIDATQKRTHRILRVNKEDLAMLRELNAGVDTLKAYQQYVKLNLRGRQELLQWQLKNHVHTIPTQWFAYMTARKFMRYMDSQLPDYMQLKRAFLYRSPMEEAISTYSDYLQMCQGQNYDMKSSQVLFPTHCNEAHDELSRYIKKCRDEQTKRAFREVYENLAEKANLTSKKLQIVCPKQTDDLITEGQALHHCVGTYIERVAAKKCLIVFVRRVEEPEKPFVTVEVSNGKIVQIRGERNSDPTKEVKKFVDLWSRKVLPMALQTA